MAFKYILIPEDIREKIFNFAEIEYNGALNVPAYAINWIYGLYDDETGLFFSFVDCPDSAKSKYFLLTETGACYFFVVKRYKFDIIEIPDEIKHYSEVIESALKTYGGEKEINNFLQGFSDEENRAFLEIKERMRDRTKPSLDINCFEDAKRLLLEVEYLDYKIYDRYNQETLDKFHRYMPEDVLHFLIGEKYREMVRGILSYGDNVSEEERDTIIMAYRDAAFICARGLDDLSVDLVLQAIKKGKKWGIEAGGFMFFMEFYLKHSLKRFKDKIMELKPILDYLNEHMVNAFLGGLEMYRSELNRLIYGKNDGFEYVFSTDEIRDRIFNFLEEQGLLFNPSINWTTGLLDENEGIFMTQIYRNPPCREVYEDFYKYIVLKDGELPFLIYGDVDRRVGEWFYFIPPKYEYLSDKLKEGIMLCQYDKQFRMNLSDEDSEKNKAINRQMKQRIEAYRESRNI